MITIPIPEGLQAAADRLQYARAELANLESVARQAREDLSTAKQKNTVVKQELAVAESSLALGQPGDSSVRKRFQAARDNVEFVEARIDGLEPKLSAAQTATTAAQAEFDTAWLAFADAQVQSYIDGRYRDAAHTYIEAVEEGHAIVQAFAGLNLADRLSRVLATECNRIPSLSGRTGEYVRDRRSWESNEKAVQLHGRLMEIKKRLGAVEVD